MRGSFCIKKNSILMLAIIGLGLLQIYSYTLGSWNSTVTGSMTVILENGGGYNSWMAILKYILFFIILYFILKYSNNRIGKSLLSVGVVFFVSVGYAFLTIFDHGINESLYLSDFPLMYLFIIGFYSGQDENIWEAIKKTTSILLPIYFLAFIFQFYTTYKMYGWAMYGKSPVVAFYSQLFWLICIFIFVQIENVYDIGKKISSLCYVFLVLLPIGAVLIRSRGWLIQSFLLMIIVMVTLGRMNLVSNSRLKNFMILLVIITGVFIGLTYVFPLYLDSIIAKGTSDTRSFQYNEIFEQTNTFQWLLGQGIDATYTSSLYGQYSYIDNSFLFIAFHYGLPLSIAYFWTYLKSIFAVIRNRRNVNNLMLLYIGLVVLWVLSLNGLSIYNGISMDVKSILMPVLAGHIFIRAWEGFNEDPIYC